MNGLTSHLFSLIIIVGTLLFWLAYLIFRLSIILLTSLELFFLRLNVKLHDLIFILSILGYLSHELTIARIGLAFCKFECSVAGIFKVNIIFAKKYVKSGANLSLDVTFPFLVGLVFRLLIHFV